MSQTRAMTVGLAVALAACSGNSGAISGESPEAVLERLRATGRAVDASMGGGAVRYLGFEAWPEGAMPGQTLTVVHWWAAVGRLDRPYRVFVHSLVAGARGWVPHADHDPPLPTDAWPAGGVIRDEHRIELPRRLPGQTLELRIGLYNGNDRLPVDAAELHDGQHAVRAGRVRIAGSPEPLPTYRAPRLARPPRIDGRIDEGEWGGAPWIGGFWRANGSGPSTRRTRARLAWDEGHLYVAFEAEDPDIIAGYARRDEPIYREEALELFIDADGDASTYEELQISPKNVQFDAAFSGGARRNMRVGWDARFESAVAVDGTVDGAGGNVAPDGDRGWSTEWAIDVSSLDDAEASLAPETRWRVNLFRIGKDRSGGERLVDESAWSPPLMGDFHNLERFGELWFVP